jgi:hypothetical protein
MKNLLDVIEKMLPNEVYKFASEFGYEISEIATSDGIEFQLKSQIFGISNCFFNANAISWEFLDSHDVFNSYQELIKFVDAINKDMYQYFITDTYPIGDRINL